MMNAIVCSALRHYMGLEKQLSHLDLAMGKSSHVLEGSS